MPRSAVPSLPANVAPVRRRDLVAAGRSAAEIDALVTEGVLAEVLRGVYLPVDHADDQRLRAAALGLVLPDGAAVCRTTAAWLHGVDCRPPGEQDKPIPLECLVAVGRTPPRIAGVRPYQALLPGTDVMDVAGITVTTADRTALDLARYLPEFMGLGVLDAMAHAGLVDPSVLAERIEEWRGDRWVDRARRVISLCEPETESFGESWLRLRLVEAGFPRPVPQIWIVDDDGVGVYRLDMGWPELRVAVEYDGVEFHSRPDQVARDARRRDRLARRWGWDVVGVGRGEVLGRGLELERGVGELLGMAPLLRRRPW
jgi:hypothetical protein